MQSLRLQQIIQYIPDGVGVADIGTDHAQIPIFLAAHSNCSPIIAGEKSAGPYSTAKHWIHEAGYEDSIDLRMGSGLTILTSKEVEWAIIAGMGFKTIIEILTEAEDVAKSLTGLILQPMQGPEELRRWLCENSYQILDEVLVKEDDKLFQIIIVRSGESDKIDDIFYEIGPVLYAKGDPHLTEHIQNLIAYHTEVLEKVTAQDNERTRARICDLQTKINRLEEVLAEWQKRSNE